MLTYHLPADPESITSYSIDTLVQEYVRVSSGKPYRRVYSANNKVLFTEKLSYRKDGRIESTQKWKSWNTVTIVKTMYYADGQVQSRVCYLDGKQDGVSLNFYPNGQVMSEAVYAFGHLKMVHQYYSSEGHPLHKGSFHDGEGILYHYKNGNTKPTCYAVYREGQVVKHKKYHSMKK